MDPKRIVADGYDRMAERYLAWAERDESGIRERYAEIATEGQPDGASILDLGCGAGVPVAALLARRFLVTGADVSARQIELARRNAPTATFLHADMTRLSFAAGSFHAVVAFYALGHVPRDEQAALFRSIACWLRPGGRLVASLPTHDDAGTVEEDWLGVPMYFSGHDRGVAEGSMRAAGLRIERARPETVDEDGRAVTFLWVVARTALAEVW